MKVSIFIIKEKLVYYEDKIENFDKTVKLLDGQFYKLKKTLSELKKDLELISKKEQIQIVGGKKEKSQMKWTIKCGGIIPQ